MRPLAVLLAATAAAVERWFDARKESDAVIHAWARTPCGSTRRAKAVKNEVSPARWRERLVDPPRRHVN